MCFMDRSIARFSLWLRWSSTCGDDHTTPSAPYIAMRSRRRRELQRHFRKNPPNELSAATRVEVSVTYLLRNALESLANVLRSEERFRRWLEADSPLDELRRSHRASVQPHQVVCRVEEVIIAKSVLLQLTPNGRLRGVGPENQARSTQQGRRTPLRFGFLLCKDKIAQRRHSNTSSGL